MFIVINYESLVDMAKWATANKALSIEVYFWLEMGLNK